MPTDAERERAKSAVRAVIADRREDAKFYSREARRDAVLFWAVKVFVIATGAVTSLATVLPDVFGTKTPRVLGVLTGMVVAVDALLPLAARRAARRNAARLLNDLVEDASVDCLDIDSFQDGGHARDASMRIIEALRAGRKQARVLVDAAEHSAPQMPQLAAKSGIEAQS